MTYLIDYFDPSAHTPDNSFMGFVVEHYPPAKRKQTAVRQQRALVYGKDLAMWKVRKSYKAHSGSSFVALGCHVIDSFML